MKSYIVKENYIGSAVSEILRYAVTHRQTHLEILLLFYKDKFQKINFYLKKLLNIFHMRNLVELFSYTFDQRAHQMSTSIPGV